MADNFITKKLAGLPVWAWGLVGIAGVGIGYFIIHGKSSGIPTGTQSSDTSSGTVQADNTGLPPSNMPVGPGDPFMSVPVGSGTVPVLPNGYQPIYDGNGNLTGYQAPPPPPVASNPNPPGGVGTPLIPVGQWGNTPIRFGQKKVVNGITYTIGPGAGGRIWGVPGTGWNLADWNRVPIGTSPGEKVLLYQQQSSQTPFKRPGSQFDIILPPH